MSFIYWQVVTFIDVDWQRKPWTYVKTRNKRHWRMYIDPYDHIVNDWGWDIPCTGVK